MVNAANLNCAACNRGAAQIFHEVADVPVNSCILLASKHEALNYPKGKISLGYCHSCGFISNLSFDSRLTEYSGRYEETQSYSPTFNAFHATLAERLINTHNLRDRDIVEIGCGKGEFLQLLCEMGNNRGVGLDPGVQIGRIHSSAARQMKFIPDYYSEKYSYLDADFIVCKMTLEHIPRVGEFVAMVRSAIGQRTGTAVFFQVPDAGRILRECSFEDIYYEHCSYFSSGSLLRLFRANGFEILNINEGYGGQYLMLEARAGKLHCSQPLFEKDTDLSMISSSVSSFKQRFVQKRRFWASRLRNITESRQKAVIWGAASKAVALLSTIPEATSIRYGVDINPHRQGHFLPGSALRIVSPAFLKEYRPDVVLVMNHLYRDEIQRSITALGLTPEILTF